ncbi:MAG TPA: tRNA pseudouridine(38-40) synthase TruA [Pseudomonadales bacterium]|nr:tRNA pseudouridine(38-40) synthase TruA [Pseudomonadales bacterium]HMU90518.1 tRNA pseudouridine(38-40) synthase TruA [Pseudomonadales bacterium]HMW15320.1 tRNA pseudouridine(38-40) synthase TruA [Pseudomonadales bacterium]HMW83555.1 tRNA pseudouridine(38-40) synthase TruA [Pseudomonadales bacterium]HMY97251.1 tRNA pseudouridine(38-40) synthase TruA [Pseudomonadales bacterium]
MSEAGSTRIALGIEYDGHPYRGWQSQSHCPGQTVQERLQAALGRVADHPVELICAGRTDAAVHATGQVVHFTSHTARPLKAWVLGTNSHLDGSIGVTWAKVVPDDFHARFSALSRRYRYLIYNHPLRPVLQRQQLSWCHQPLSVEPMQQAAQALVGEHDFNAYRAVACQARSAVRRVDFITVGRIGRLVMIDIQANGFLHHMVRNIAGVLIRIGAGEAEPEWAQQVLESRDRTRGGVTAPPQGLYLVAVGYPQRFDLPRLPLGPLWMQDAGG